jgi:hypothetical protein
MPADRYTRRLKSPIGLQRQVAVPFDNGTEEFMLYLADTLSGLQHRVSL